MIKEGREKEILAWQNKTKIQVTFSVSTPSYHFFPYIRKNREIE